MRAKICEIAANIKPMSVAWNFAQEKDQAAEKRERPMSNEVNNHHLLSIQAG
jgi:hypothetical protein